ncbi:Uu.00g098840.m01.CDS01 [Anthostomella pinea]|uniref:Uu.00g098840.m01.CDS01 n=1 Tax=Anthostomella pinea TaxID=933095 RepID=A0AAI8VCM7_9PEZI|nr:Uu.00g098840.m01.CDS01 [Anthostomella pinea]
MTPAPKYPRQGRPPRRYALRNVTDSSVNTKRVTPLFKIIASKVITEASPPPIKAQRHVPDQRVRPGDVIIHPFDSPKHFDGAVRIFTRLPFIPGLFGQTPRLYGKDRNRLEIQIQYPKYGFWRVVNRLHLGGDPTAARLRVHHIRQLQGTLLNNITILCAWRIAFSSDVSNLRIVHQCTPSSMFLPLFDTFDPTTCAEQDDETPDWMQREQDMVRKVVT